MRRLYLMRHGETLYLGGRSEDGSDLTPEGRRQVERAAEAFRGLSLDLVVSSPARRSVGTAQIVAGSQGVPVEVMPDLREITPGRLSGQDLGQIFSQVVAFFTDGATTSDTPFLGGETFRTVRARTAGVVEALLGRPGWSNALAVAHGGANMALLAGVLGLDAGEIPRLEQDLACINAIDFFDDGPRGLIRLVNFSAHDPLKAAILEPSSARLRRVLSEYGEHLKGVRWDHDDLDPEI